MIDLDEKIKNLKRVIVYWENFDLPSDTFTAEEVQRKIDSNKTKLQHLLLDKEYELISKNTKNSSMTNLIEKIPLIFVTTKEDKWTGRFDNITNWQRPVMITIYVEVTKEKNSLTANEVFYVKVYELEDVDENYIKTLYYYSSSTLEEACKSLLGEILDSEDSRELLDMFTWSFIKENH
jgi:hypothetical protein